MVEVVEKMKCSSQDSDTENDSNWQDELQSYRFLIVERIHHEEISAALQSVKVIDQEDDQLIRNPFVNKTARMRNNCLVDTLLRKGEENYNKFLKVLGIYYPELYTHITGMKPPDSSDLLSGDGGRIDNQHLIQLLMQALEGMKQKCFDFSKQLKRSSNVVEERTQEIERLKQKTEDLKLRVTRYESIDNEMDSLRKEVDRLKNENYTLCMRIIDANEESRKLRVSNMTLSSENDKLTVDLQKMESYVALERTQSVRLRNRLQCRPSDKDMIEMKKEIDELKLKLAQANSQKFQDDGIDMRIQILQRDKEEAIEVYAAALEDLNKLRNDCSNAETLRDKYQDEKEQLSLSCSVLKSDCDMYKMRRDAVWQQLQEVEKEREILMKERNEAQANTKVCMQEKAKYRSQIRELEEKYDQMSHTLHEKERELIRLRSAARNRQICDDDKDYVSSEWIRPPLSYPSLASSNSNSQAASPQKPCSNASSEGSSRPFRQRAYVTKHYNKFVKSKPSLEDVAENFGDGLVNVFPEIPLANNYGVNDNDFSTTTPTFNSDRKTNIKQQMNDGGRKVRLAASRGRADTDRSRSDTLSSSTSIDDSS